MREIKFRAWNEIDKKMFEVCGFSTITDEHFREPERKHTKEIQQLCLRSFSDGVTYEKPNWINVDRSRLMQFTGLFDIKATPIFEGDIVQYGQEEATQEKGKIIFDFAAFGIQRIGKSWNVRYDLKHVLDDSKYFEIIGNIYENPELLNS